MAILLQLLLCLRVHLDPVAVLTLHKTMTISCLAWMSSNCLGLTITLCVGGPGVSDHRDAGCVASVVVPSAASLLSPQLVVLLAAQATQPINGQT